jgi:tetratricopeptide (TPR) repeat protein
MPREAGYALRILGEIARSGGDLEQADAYFTEGYGTLAEAGDDYERAKVCLAQAHLYAAQGRAEQALASLGEGEEIARRLGMEAALDEMTTLRRSLQ